ncbi:hypothetical protein JCM19037_3169 [Geomicrobium sp. JCM 19037]|uniref:hypothetical protein n=1 Tax=unclassified Geomicrobium TaxID=2628951 RepID=UPI00045F2F54|nr:MULTISPECIES: hypothetical protein [unclassified Geomicrobium]GAK04727.1 hypothetical protein JCM19037_3169 [Geomicrobium sp. JCM 19037]GAK13836.1 hypothetical protein JCM19039_3713 [Geomicrobium sp. JCM 19039]
MKFIQKIVVKSALSSGALVLAVLLLPVFLITEQVDGFQQLIDMVFKEDKE